MLLLGASARRCGGRRSRAARRAAGAGGALRPLAVDGASRCCSRRSSPAATWPGPRRRAPTARPVAGAHLACGKEFPTCLGEVHAVRMGEMVDVHLTHRAFMYLAAIAVLALVAVARAARDALAGALRSPRCCSPSRSCSARSTCGSASTAALVVAHLTLGTLLWGDGGLRGDGAAPGPEPGRAPLHATRSRGAPRRPSRAATDAEPKTHRTRGRGEHDGERCRAPLRADRRARCSAARPARGAARLRRADQAADHLAAAADDGGGDVRRRSRPGRRSRRCCGRCSAATSPPAAPGRSTTTWSATRDARMARTRGRPLASGRIEPLHGLVFGIALGALAVLELALAVNVARRGAGARRPARLRVRLHAVAQAAHAAEHRHRRRRGRRPAARRLGGGDRRARRSTRCTCSRSSSCGRRPTSGRSRC